MALDIEEMADAVVPAVSLPEFAGDVSLALASGEIHNKLVARILDDIGDGYAPPDFPKAALRAACATGRISPRAAREIDALIDAIDLGADDLGLEQVNRKRRQAIRDDADLVVIVTGQVAAASIETGLERLAVPGGEPQAKRRRIWKIVLSDVGGAILGWLGGGIGGAILGGVGASVGAAGGD